MTSTLWKYAISGVNFSIAGNGGPECVQYIPMWQRWLETILFVSLSIYGILKSTSELEVPSSFRSNTSRMRHKCISGHQTMAISSEKTNKADDAAVAAAPAADDSIGTNQNPDSIWDQTLDGLADDLDTENSARCSILTFYSLIFGAELAYKMVSRTCIFLLNPCHLATVMQLMLLTMHPNKRNTCLLFRFHMYSLSGAVIAIAFPVLNTRVLPGEVFIYFTQHLLILLVPLYLMSIGGAYTPEPWNNYAWPIIGFAFTLLYHFILLQIIGVRFEVNVSCILCPAISDPFRGRYYRLLTVSHQCLMMPLVTKIYNHFATSIISLIRWCSVVQCEVCMQKRIERKMM